MINNNKVEKVNEESNISKEDIIKKYIKIEGKEPTWKEKKHTEMTKEESNEYKKYRKRVEKDNNSKKIDKDAPRKQTRLTEEELLENTKYTANKIITQELETEKKELTDKQEKLIKQNDLIEKYCKNHNISTQEQFNYAVERDEKFKIFIEKTGRLDELYTGNYLELIEEERKEVMEEAKKDAIKDKMKRVVKRFKKKKKNKGDSNNLKDSKKNLDLTPYISQKLEKQGSILCFYLKKNSLAEARYVKMDEVGQIKVDGYVYHERDAIYRFGKKNTPVLVIMEGALVPVNKNTLKENLGCESAEAQKLIIKGIEQAEVVKSGDLDANAKKTAAPSKLAIGIGIAVIIGIYAFMGGFSG